MRHNHEISQSRAYLESVLIDKDPRALEEFLLPNCFAFTDYGIAFGVDEIATDLELFFQSVEIKSLSIGEQVQFADTTILKFSEKCRHVGEFYGIEATGKDFVFNTSITLHWYENKIRDYLLSPDIKGVLKQLGDGYALNRKLNRLVEGQDRGYALISKIIAVARHNGLHLTRQQLRCLALYFQGYSTVASAKILGCSYQTVRTHIKNIREHFSDVVGGNMNDWFYEHHLDAYLRRYARLIHQGF